MHPFGHWRPQTFIAALRHDRLDAPWIINGAMNAEIVQRYVETQLVPILRPGERNPCRCTVEMSTDFETGRAESLAFPPNAGKGSSPSVATPVILRTGHWINMSTARAL